MIRLGVVYLVLFAAFCIRSLSGEIKKKRYGRFANSLAPFVAPLIASVGFLFLDKPGEWSWLIVASMVISFLCLMWDSMMDVAKHQREYPEDAPALCVASWFLIAVTFGPAFVMGFLWAL